ncbi:MAG: ABC transporter ATP-binding protein [Nitrososphaerales archaeon]|jgi:oligopeptide/dipeptide ABC transporter ATP-binding protein
METTMGADENDRTDDGPVIELSGIGVTHHIKGSSGRRTLEALRHLDLEIAPQELVVVVGESGSGKTTLGRVIAGLQKPTHGTMKFMGTDLSKASREEFLRYRRAVQMVHQDPYTSLNPALTIEESLTAGMKRWDPWMKKEDLLRRAGELLVLVGLSEERHLQKYPHQLSGGQRQRVAIARALSISPELLVLDEPVSMIDASLRIDILDVLIEIKRKFGTGFLFITHDVALARYLCEKAGAGRTAVLYRGSLMELGETHDVIEAPANPYMMALIASSPGSRTGSSAWSTKLANSPEDDVEGCRFYQRCIYAQAVCAAKEPPLSEVAPGHLSACHFNGALVQSSSTPSSSSSPVPSGPGATKT